MSDQTTDSRNENGERLLHAETGEWGRTRVRIDLAALERNFRRVATRLPEGGRVIASVKKDAYGHGLLPVVRALAALEGFGAAGVATIEEAIALRKAGVTVPVIIFSVLEGEALAEAVRQDATLTVGNLAEARLAAAAAATVGKTARLHLKVDTGMGRLGRTVDEIAEEVPTIRALEGTRLEAVHSHLADGWANPASARAQWERMEELRRRTDLTGLTVHWGGSDALGIGERLAEGTWLRFGIALYGDHPAIPELEPVMTFVSKVVYRRRVPAGTAISYGMTYTTQRPTELALVGAGYGNGVLRSLSGRGETLLRGRRCPILGRVCMDQFAVDVTECPEVVMGEEAVLFGRQGDAILPAAEAAARAGTISYELFCLAGQLNPREYL